MKKYLPYLFAFAVIALLVTLILQDKKAKHRFDPRLTFDKSDKRPYGNFVAYNNLRYLFPDASISVNKNQPGSWDSLSDFSEDQVLMVISPRFEPDEFQLKRLMKFVKAGNYIFISAKSVSIDAEKFFNTEIITSDFALPKYTEILRDSLGVQFRQPPFPAAAAYFYPGFRYDGYFLKYDSAFATILGYNDTNLPNFIEYRVGDGKVFLHLAPLAFSNYFLLHHNNISYYDKALSVIPSSVNMVVWDEYFKNKKDQDLNRENDSSEDGRGALYRLMSDPSFSAAFWLLLALFLLFILQEMRRKQRLIPEFAKPRNDSLEFVKTIGRLYHEKADNLNLCRKMSSYFLDHVRNRFKLSTARLDEDFIFLLQRKTGGSETNIRGIVSFIKFIEEADAVSDDQLSEFHKELERFYRNE